MSNEYLTKDILEFATKDARDRLPKSFGEYGSFGAVLKGEDTTLNFYSELRNALERNGAVSEAGNFSMDQKNGSRATAFASSVLTSLYMTDILCDNIDAFCDNPENDYRFRDQTPEQKEAFRQELKDKVRNDLAVKPKTREGEALAENLKQRFDRVTEFKEANRGQAKQLKDDGLDMSRLGTDLYGEGMAAIYAINSGLLNGKNVRETAASVRENAPKNHDFYKIILESFENDAKELATEEEVITHTVKQFNIDVNNTFDITPTGFMERYNKGKLTPEDKGWAMNVAGKMGIEYGDFENLKLNGKKMFEPWNLHKEDELDRTADVVGALLSGKEVALENQKDNTLTLLNPMIKGTLKERESKGIIDTIIEFFKSLVGIDSRQKEQDKIKMMDLDAQKAKTNFMEKSRERISFKELSGLNSLKKVNAPTQKQNTLSAEKKGASRGK